MRTLPSRANQYFAPYRKIPWRLSSRQKFRQRKRLRAVDNVVDTVAAALERNGMNQVKAVQRWYAEMPREEEMRPKDKYTIYDRKEKNYRKGIHSECSIAEQCRVDIVKGLEQKVDSLKKNRITQVDKSQSTSEPSRFLNIRETAANFRLRSYFYHSDFCGFL